VGGVWKATSKKSAIALQNASRSVVDHVHSSA
jgi:hypothetical protein